MMQGAFGDAVTEYEMHGAVERKLLLTCDFDAEWVLFRRLVNGGEFAGSAVPQELVRDL